MPRKPNARALHTRPAEQVPLPAASDPAGPDPVQLTGDRLKLWKDIRARYVLESASEALLRTSCEALERAAGLAQQVTAEGATFRDRFGGLKTNPAATLERDFRALASRTLSQLASRLEG
jgi:hypothetical protein